jgi:hypothetical protein
MREIRFHASVVCNMYQQPECRNYKKGMGVSPGCLFGMPDRPCNNMTLRLEAFEAAIRREVRRRIVSKLDEGSN